MNLQQSEHFPLDNPIGQSIMSIDFGGRMIQIEKTPCYINRPGKPRNCTASSKVTSVSLRRAATIHGWSLGQPRTTLLLLHTGMARRPCQGWRMHRAAALDVLLRYTARPPCTLSVEPDPYAPGRYRSRTLDLQLRPGALQAVSSFLTPGATNSGRNDCWLRPAY